MVIASFVLKNVPFQLFVDILHFLDFLNQFAFRSSAVNHLFFLLPLQLHVLDKVIGLVQFLDHYLDFFLQPLQLDIALVTLLRFLVQSLAQEVNEVYEIVADNIEIVIEELDIVEIAGELGVEERVVGDHFLVELALRYILVNVLNKQNHVF